MASVNKAIIVGNLGRDPELRYLQDQSAVTTLNIATTRSRKDQNGNRVDETEWHHVVFFGKQAENASKYLKKGSSCYVEGRLRTRKYTGKDGVERYTTEIMGELLQFLDKKADSNQGTASAGYDDAPF